MIQYYLNKVIDILTYALKPEYETIGSNSYLVEPVPEESTNNRYGHINSPFQLDTIGSVNGNTFQSFKGEVMQGVISDYALKKISYNFSSFTRAFNIITPETEDGYTFMIIKNNLQRYLLIHKGFSSAKYTIPKGATNQDVEFLILRISDTEVLFFANTPEDWRYEMYYGVPGNPLNASHRHFTNIPSLHIFPNAAAVNEYIFRARGKDGDGNLTEWSTELTDGTDAFFVPLFDNESTNQYMPELEKVNLTSNLFSIVFYPKFEQGLGMIGVQHNNDQEILRSTDLDRVYANTSDAVKPNVDAVLEMHRFNPQSERYQNLLYQLGTQDLDVRAQLEWDAINGVEIPEVVIPEVTIKRESATEYLVEGVNSEMEANLVFKRLSDDYVQNVGNVTLPYTFTHTEGEVWEVSADGGFGYVSAWGVEFASNTYATGNYSTIPQLDSFEVGFYQSEITSNKYIFAVEYGTGSNNFKNLIGSLDGDFGIYATTNKRRSFSTFKPNLYNHYKHDSTGQYLNGEMKDAATVITHEQNYFFTLGRRRNAPTIGKFTGIICYLKISGEEFKMNEGQGTEIMGSNGNSFTLINPTWVKI